MRIERFAFHLIGLGVLLYSTGPVLARSANTSGALLSMWRLWFGTALFSVALAGYRLAGNSLGSARGARLAALAGAIFAVNQVAFFTAIQRTSVVDASLMSTLSPVVVAVVAIPLFGERPAPSFRWWSLLSLAGAAYVVIGSSSGVEGDLAGMLLALLSTVAFAGFFLTSKVARPEMPVVAFLTIALAVAGVVVTGWVLLTGLDPMSVSGSDRIRAVVMAAIPGGLGHVVMTLPLAYLPANVPPLFRLTGPAVAGAMAWVFLGEGFTAVHLLGGAVIVTGIAGAILSPAGKQLVAQARTSAA